MSVDIVKQLDRAKRYVEKNRLDDAIEAYQSVLTTFPNHLESIQSLGDLYTLQNRPDRAAFYYGMLFDRFTAPREEAESAGSLHAISEAASAAAGTRGAIRDCCCRNRTAPKKPSSNSRRRPWRLNSAAKAKRRWRVSCASRNSIRRIANGTSPWRNLPNGWEIGGGRARIFARRTTHHGERDRGARIFCARAQIAAQ